jgi:glycerol-3-phosphate dehydrogenase
LPATSTVDLARGPLGAPLQGRYRTGFEYSDCQTDDTRLVVLNALDAAERGAAIRTRTRCVDAERGEAWQLVLEAGGQREIVSARALVNATGPWAAIFRESILRMPPPPRRQLRLDQGSHIVVRRLFDHDRGYIFQTRDKRVVFALPYESDFTLIGTTDRAFSGDPASVAPAADEIAYLCEVVNDHFRARIAATDVLWSFAGVRALYDDGSRRPQDTPRDYVLALEAASGNAPLLTIYGGKITTFRRLAEAAIDRLTPYFGARPAWTGNSSLPGGDIAVDGFQALVAETLRRWPFLGEALAGRLARAYGTRVGHIVGSAKNLAHLGENFGADLTAAEVRYLVAHEWAETADDVLWRRSKLGLRVSAEGRARLAQFMSRALHKA